MMPLILSLITTVVFLTISSLMYGSAAIVSHAWVSMVVAGLLVAGASLFLLGRRADLG